MLFGWEGNRGPGGK